jgi:hypothetical protein
VVIRPERRDEDWPPENFLIKRSSAELRRLRIQSVNRVLALTLTLLLHPARAIMAASVCPAGRLTVARSPSVLLLGQSDVC